jgi:hypothetical protein
VLEHIGRVTDVHRTGAHRQLLAAAADHARGGRPARGQLAHVRVEAEVAGAGGAEGVGEVARPATDVEEPAPGQRHVLGELAHRVGGQHGVEQIGVGLLAQESAEQAHRAVQRGRPALRGNVRHSALQDDPECSTSE